jgi:hypothetical protein
VKWVVERTRQHLRGSVPEDSLPLGIAVFELQVLAEKAFCGCACAVCVYVCGVLFSNINSHHEAMRRMVHQHQ